MSRSDQVNQKTDKEIGQPIDPQLSLIGKSPRMREIAYEIREPLINPNPTIFEYIVNHLQIIIIISLILLAVLFILNSQILENILCSGVTKPPTVLINDNISTTT